MTDVVTRLDLSTVETSVEPVDNSVWHNVEYKGDRYILVATNVTDDDIERMFHLDPITAIMYITGQFPKTDAAVFRGDENWNIVGECDETCKEGVCNRRVASSEVGDIEQAYVMLIDFLNA